MVDLKQSIRFRKRIFALLPKFAKVVKESKYGRQIKVEVYLTDWNEVRLQTTFRPRKNQHPTDADDTVDEAFDKSGLGKYMGFSGSGTCCGGKDDGLRDIDFTERKFHPLQD